MDWISIKQTTHQLVAVEPVSLIQFSGVRNITTTILMLIVVICCTEQAPMVGMITAKAAAMMEDGLSKLGNMTSKFNNFGP